VSGSSDTKNVEVLSLDRVLEKLVDPWDSGQKPIVLEAGE
jgi:hypothetical protein